MLETIQPTEISSPVCVHTIQKGKAKRPLFFLHGAWTGGAPLYCFTLARSLGREQPFYALDPYDVSGPDVPLTLEEMAATYIQTIRAIQPVGPYQLGGFCSGAFLTYEMTRQLQEQGEEVDLLLLIALSSITDMHRETRDLISFLAKVFPISRRRELDGFLYLRHILRHIYRKLLPPNNAKIKDFPKLLALEPRLNAMIPPVEALYKDFSGIYTWLAAGYKPSFSPKQATFIWAGEDLDARLIWESVEQGKSSTIIPGSYMELINEHLDLLVEQVKISASRP